MMLQLGLKKPKTWHTHKFKAIQDLEVDLSAGSLPNLCQSNSAGYFASMKTGSSCKAAEVIEGLPRGDRELELGSKVVLQERCMKATSEGRDGRRYHLRSSAGNRSCPVEKAEGSHVEDTARGAEYTVTFRSFNRGKE
jgi:hypothetical protein